MFYCYSGLLHFVFQKFFLWNTMVSPVSLRENKKFGWQYVGGKESSLSSPSSFLTFYSYLRFRPILSFLIFLPFLLFLYFSTFSIIISILTSLLVLSFLSIFLFLHFLFIYTFVYSTPHIHYTVYSN